MSLPWFRLDVDVVDHPKVHHLEQLLGSCAGWYLVRLWAWTARYASRGRLSTIARASLERSCGWTGEPGKLTGALLEAGLLDETGSGELEVHDWWEKQRAIVEKAENDRERQRLSREARGIVPRQSREAREVVAGDETRRDETEQKEEAVEQARPRPLHLEAKLTDDEFQVFEHWRKVLNHPKAQPTSDRKRLIAKQLKVYSVSDLQAAIDGCSRTPWNMGANPQSKRYDSLELILRDAKHIEDFMGVARVA